MGIETVLGILASILAELVVVDGVQKFIARQNRIFDRAIKTTNAAFTAYEGVEISLREWSSSDAFATALKR